MKKSLIALLFLASCTTQPVDQPIALSPRKQKQRIAILKKKLGQAEEEQKKAQEEVERISTEINTAELALIRKHIDQYEQKSQKAPALFLDEREALYRMIQSGPTPASLEAQLELDRILRMITAFSDE